MKASRSRVARYLAGVGLTTLVAFACSSDPATLPAGFDNPASLEISRVSLSTGNVLDGGSTQLACDYKIAVVLSVENWDLRQPGACPYTQCGRVQLTLSDSSGEYVRHFETASAGVNLSIAPSVAGDGGATSMTQAPVSGMYTLSAELINDAGNPYNPGDAGNGSAQASVSFQLELPTNCDANGSAGAAGTGATTEGGAAGVSGSAGAPGIGGAAGDRAAGGSSGAGDSSSAGDSGAGGSGASDSGAGGAPPEAGSGGV